jgi:hypothetical protein
MLLFLVEQKIIPSATITGAISLNTPELTESLSTS